MFWATIIMSLREIRRNTMRSLLTTLGIVIGVGAVIAMVAIGAGAQARLQQAFDAMGTNLLVIQSGSSRAGGVQGGAGSAQTLTWADLEAIRNEASAVRYIAPVLSSRVQMSSDLANWSTSAQGTTGDFFAIRGWDTDRGALFGIRTVSSISATTNVTFAVMPGRRTRSGLSTSMTAL